MQWMRHVKWGRWISNFFISGILMVFFIEIPDFLMAFLKHTALGSFLVPYFVVSYLLFWVMLPKNPHKIRLYYALGTTGACLLFFLLFMLLMFTIMLISALLFDSFS
ncbi:hypothetical protein ACFVAD_01110 [Sutcliffiella sp. NPDC057660]|uniref:hypothetical protein n=1 Tax=Sutcliffiella sp. NPDC057660 TaxID=3346199 RepID=UPI00368FDA50